MFKKDRLCIITFFLAALFLSGCSSPTWHRTNEGLYIYCEANDNYILCWEGDAHGCFAEGRGRLVSYKNGKVKRTQVLEPKFGVVDDEYGFYGNYRYLGETDNDIPNGVGVKFHKDTISIGIFKNSHFYSGLCEQYLKDGDRLLPLFSGTLKKGKLVGQAKFYENGLLQFEGSFKKGKRHGLGKEYEQGVLTYVGNYKKGLKNGLGKSYKNGKLVYDGEWKNDLYDGEGMLYNAQGALLYDGEWKKGKKHGYGTLYDENGLIKYEGKWRKGLYDGNGKLYENGECTEGKWDEGMLTKTIATSPIQPLVHATKMWFHTDSINSESEEEIAAVPAATNQIEFIEQLHGELNEKLQEEFAKRVDKRFGFWHLLRMWGQPWLRSDVKRARFAQTYFCKHVDAKEMQQQINAKIDNYNQYTSADEKLNFVKLAAIPNGSVVNSDVALKIFDREAVETTDAISGVLIDILICFVVAFIIGFLVGFFVPVLVPYLGIVDLLMSLIAFGIGIYLTFIRTMPISIELENQITEMLVQNYMQYLDSQNIIMQMIGAL